MTPTCLRSGCRQPVERAYGRRQAKTAYRVIGGLKWRSFCSRKCSGLGTTDARWATYRVAVRRRLSLEVKTLTSQRFTAADLARALWNAEQRGYHRGYMAAWHRKAAA